MRSTLRIPLAVVALGVVPCAVTPSVAQEAFGLGGRFSVVRREVQGLTVGDRFTGGHLRARVSPKTALELSLDVRTTRSEDLTERVRDIPIQASLLLYPMSTAFSPYVLGGGGWYSHRVERFAGDEVIESATTRDFGWHGGFGAELRLGRHAGVHGDYRYTFLRFSDDESKSVVSRFLPSHDGSMWTAGLTVYF
jgi:hypothetical protein